MTSCDWELPKGDDSVRCSYPKGHASRHSFEPVQVIETNVGRTHFVGDDCLGGHADVVGSIRGRDFYARSMMEAHDREVRIATLVEAAGLMCVHCLNGEELGHRPSDKPQSNYEAFFHWTQWEYEDKCDAYNINAELARIWGENR